MMRTAEFSLGLLCSCVLAVSAFAADGVIQINQARALAGGVVPADAPGFPVLIDASGSYVLTSNLMVPDQLTDGILVTADRVTIDLNGFGIIGPVICNASGSNVLCSPAGSGIGVHAQQIAEPASRADRTVVRNGFISGMGGTGVVLREGGLVDSVLIEHCADGGVLAQDDSLVTRSRILLNEAYGLQAESGVVTFQANRFAEIGGPTIIDATEIGGNTCDDGLCSAVPLRRYYLTRTTHDGDTAMAACDDGYHMAAMYEIVDPSNLSYDGSRGESSGGDSPPGPPVIIDAMGWMRTGSDSSISSSLGRVNCDAWGMDSLVGFGSHATLNGAWNDSGNAASPWSGGTATCNTDLRVWCVQD